MTLKAEFLQTSKVTLYVWTHIMFLHDFQFIEDKRIALK